MTWEIKIYPTIEDLKELEKKLKEYCEKAWKCLISRSLEDIPPSEISEEEAEKYKSLLTVLRYNAFIDIKLHHSGKEYPHIHQQSSKEELSKYLQNIRYVNNLIRALDCMIEIEKLKQLIENEDDDYNKWRYERGIECSIWDIRGHLYEVERAKQEFGLTE